MGKSAFYHGICGRALLRMTALVVLVCCLVAPAAQARPQRVVSFNLCSDQLIVALADPAQIAGLSPLAADPALSVVAHEAARYRRLDWSAESLVELAPDLVFVGPSDRPTRAMLAAMGIRIVEVPFIADLDDARKQVREMAALLGQDARGTALIAQLDDAEKNLASRARKRTALVIERGGYAAGPRSLIGAMLKVAGLTPPARGPGDYGGFVSLEDVIGAKPDLLVLKDAPDVARDQGALFLTHPALAKLYPPQRRINIPARYTLCGGPALVEAMNALARELAR